MKEIIQSNFVKGINRDIHPRFQPAGTYPHALNKKKGGDRFYSGGLTNELQNLYAATIPGTIVGFHRIEERNSTLFFHTDGGSSISLYNHDTDVVTPVVTDSDFGCDWGFKDCGWIGYGHSDSKTIAPCNDLIVYWASGLYYYKANIDELLDDKRRESISLQENVCDYFKLFKCISGPRLKVRTNRGGGRDLVPGQYYVVSRFLDESGNSSNWSTIEGPTFIGSKYNKFTDISHQSIQIEAKSLPKHYSRIQIAVIPPIGSAAEDIAYVIYDGSYNTNGVTAQYYSQSQHKEAIPMSQILVRDIKWLRGKSLIADDGKLHLYETVQEFNPKVQEWAQQVKLYAMAYAVPLAQSWKFRSLPSDEVAAFGIEYQYCDQTRTAVGHIPGTEGGANELDCGDCQLPPGHTSNNAAVIETYNTITGAAETLCVTGGQQTTINEGHHPTTDGACGEVPIEIRASDNNDCVDQHTDRQAVEDKIDAIQTENVDDCLDCNTATTSADLEQSKGFLINKIEQLTDLFKTDKEVADHCSTGDNSTIKDAAKQLYDEAVVHAENDEEVLTRTAVVQNGGTTVKVTGAGMPEGTSLILGVNKGEDCVTEDIEPILLAKYSFGGWESSLTYPRTLDCDGKPLYGDLAGLPIRHHKVPDHSIHPLYISFQNGVESRFDPSNTPGKDTYVVMFGLLAENVYIPSFEAGEIPKPLDGNTPWRIVMVEREKHNQSVVARGYFTNTFSGKVGEKEYAVPRHAANCYADVDRGILHNESHLGEDWNLPIYNFHSPDMGTSTDFISGDYVKIEAILSGNGMCYGLYDDGKEVKDDENQKDRRGARGALNFTQWTNSKFQTCIKGIEFAEFNTNLPNPQGISKPLLNKNRESSIYLETNDLLPTVGNEGKDHSFNVGGLDHEYTTDGQVLYGSIKRLNSQQYGSIEGLQYADIGLVGRSGETSVRGLVGDTFVQKWSDKRSSYISDKVGNVLNKDYPITASDIFLGPAGAAGMDRSICDPPNRRGYRMLDFLGFWNRTELPKNGDKKDPKNMANGHPTRSAAEIKAKYWAAETDLYYPRTLNHLNHLVVETDINLHFRSTNIPATREVFYEELQGLDVDSSINQVDPEDAWLNDWYNEQLQPSKKQKNKRAMIRFALVIGGPLLLAGGIAAISTPLQGATTMLVSPFFGILWLILTYNILTSKKLDRLLGIPLCKTDDEGAQGENNTKGNKDNWTAYNYGFSAVNDLNFFFGMPQIYNTCRCTAFSNIVYSSNKQIDTSPNDAWSNFQALSYTGLAGDSGQLRKLFIWGNGLYAQTTDGLFQLQHKNPSIPMSGSSLVLGGSAFIESPTKFGNGIEEGLGGTVDPNAAMTFKGGHVSIDYEAGDISIFNGKTIDSIVGQRSGLYNYWLDNVGFCTDGCRDELSPKGIHYTFGYDPEYELLMVTKHDGESSHTWSYDLGGKVFVSEHSFIPDFYFWDRNKLFSVKDGSIYRHNMEGKYSTYYGKEYPSTVDICIHSGNGEVFEYSHCTLDTEVNQIAGGTKPNLFDRDETYQYVTAWNQFQNTGVQQIINEDQQDAKKSTETTLDVTTSRRLLHKWKINNLRSFELDRDVPVVNLGICGGVEMPNTDNINTDKADQEAKKIKGRWLQYRFEFKKNDRQIILFGIDTHVDKVMEI